MRGQSPVNRLETRAANTGHMSEEPDWAPLTGFRVAVTSARRADELSALLRKRGASVTAAAAIEMVPLPDDQELRLHTEALIDAHPDLVIEATGIRFRRGAAGGMVAVVGVVAGIAALPCRGRHLRSAHRGAAARRDRGMGPVP